MVHNDQAASDGHDPGHGFNWVYNRSNGKCEGSEGAIDFGSSTASSTANARASTSVQRGQRRVGRTPGFDGSVGGPPADPQKFANFLGALAGKYCGGLRPSKCGRQNLHYEWTPLNRGEYVACWPILCRHQGACPSMYASAASSPGGNNPPYAMDVHLSGADVSGGSQTTTSTASAPTSGKRRPAWEGACELPQVSGNTSTAPAIRRTIRGVSAAR